MNNSLQVSQLDSEIPSSKVGLQLNCKQIDTLKGKEKRGKVTFTDFQNQPGNPENLRDGLLQ